MYTFYYNELLNAVYGLTQKRYLNGMQ